MIEDDEGERRHRDTEDRTTMKGREPRAGEDLQTRRGNGNIQADTITELLPQTDGWTDKIMGGSTEEVFLWRDADNDHQSVRQTERQTERYKDMGKQTVRCHSTDGEGKKEMHK